MRIGLIGTPVNPLEGGYHQHPLADRFGDTDIRVYPSWVSVSTHTPLLQAIQVLGFTDAALMAAEDGCNALVIDNIGDFGLAVMRSLLPVPVVGPGEVAIRQASRANRKFGIVTVWPESQNFVLIDQLRMARCEKLCVGIANMMDESCIDRLLFRQDKIISSQNLLDIQHEMVLGHIKGLVEKGAEAIILGCTSMFGFAEMMDKRSEFELIDPLAAAIIIAQQCDASSQVIVPSFEHKALLRTMIDNIIVADITR